MASLTCRICLLPCDTDALNARSLSEEDETSGETLGHKLRLLGFLQDSMIESLFDDFPSHLCCWCATRVADAYDLKVQCLKVQDQLSNRVNSSLMECSLDGICQETSKHSAFRNSTGFSQSLNLKEAPPSTPILLMTASAHDMFTCIQNISFSLRLNSLLMSNATQFLENILSLLTVLISSKGETPAMKRSAIAIRSEVDLWKMKSAMVSDAASFVKEITSSKGINRTEKRSEIELPPASRIVSKHQVELHTISKTKCPSKSPVIRLSLQETSMSSDSSSAPCSNVLNSVAMDMAMTYETTQNVSLRRSFRSKSTVDHLVYWPSFKKSGIPKKPFKNFSTWSHPAEIHRDLIDKREAESNINGLHGSDDKLVLVRKRRNSGESGEYEWKLKFKPKSSCDTPATPVGKFPFNSSPRKTDEEGAEAKEMKEIENVDQSEDYSLVSSKTCTICGKILSCNRNLQAHLRLHSGSSPHKCNYCSKVFSSSWNLVQHERVHTGEKPYVCNICHMAFRYNVTLRNHKSKNHSTG